jgi:hypothetical protein
MKVKLRTVPERSRLQSERTRSGRDLMRVSKLTRGELDRVRAAIEKAANEKTTPNDYSNRVYYGGRYHPLGYDELIYMLCEAFDGAAVVKK